MEETPPTPPGAPPAIGLLTIREKWADLLKAAFRHNRNLPPLLDHVTVREVDGNIVVMTVQNPIFKEKLDADDRRKALLAALREVYKLPLQVRIDVADAAASSTSPDTQEIIARDELVAFGVQSLGGEVSGITSAQEEESDE